MLTIYFWCNLSKKPQSKKSYRNDFRANIKTLKELGANFDIFWGGKWDHRESENHTSVRRSNNDVRASTKLFSLNLSLIWLHIFKGCFVDVGNMF